MRKIRLPNPQTAQGMVEFALVLPILLLLILGVFAFGHMFFVYSSVVSASREAARWGAAVGEAPSAFPRYQDCASIRAAAVRVGRFAGVNATDIIAGNPNDPGVGIVYDHGPVEPPDDPLIFDSCPEGDIGPDVVELGDRIVVTVRVAYTPIVPFINIPSFPLEATTARTILIDVPVGEAPIAEDPCIVMTAIDIVADPEPSVVGQAVNYLITVNVPEDFTNIPSGTVRLVDSPDGNMAELDLVPATGTAGVTWTYNTAGTRNLTAEYIPAEDDFCHLPSVITPLDNINHVVEQAPTEMLFTLSPGTPVQRQPVIVEVEVRALLPGTGIPSGPVSITMPGLPVCVETLDASGRASCTFIPSNYGPSSFTGVYAEDADPDYAAVSRVLNVNVIRAGTATPTTPPVTPTPSVATTPTKTALPDFCPRATGLIDFSVPSALQFNIANTGPGAEAVEIESVEMYWPDLPLARWQEIRFGPDVSFCSQSNPKNCPWKDTTGLSPTHQTVTSSVSGWVQQAAGLAVNETKTMRLVFSGTLPSGLFQIKVRFDNNCVVEIERTRQ